MTRHEVIQKILTVTHDLKLETWLEGDRAPVRVDATPVGGYHRSRRPAPTGHPASMPQPRRSSVLKLVTLALLAPACSKQPEPSEPSGSGGEASCAQSALLITLDTTRADALSCYGKYPGVTPHLDRLAEEGLLYEAAYTAAPITLPAHASMLTGLYPLRHGVRVNGASALPQAAVTLAESARDAGLQTAAFIAALVLDDAFGIAQGFETFDKPQAADKKLTTHYTERPAREVIDRAVEWLRNRDRSRRFFLWVHLFDPHWPPHEPDSIELDLPQRVASYLGEVARMDREIGRLLSELEQQGVDRETIVLALGDHGEGLGEHGETTHAMFCYETTLRIPMILRYPDRRRAGERSRELASVVDVHPTLAGALGLPAQPGLDGFDLTSGPVPAGRGVYFESYSGYLSYGWSPFAGWLDAGGKYVHSSRPEFFDLKGDPGEVHDLAPERGPELDHFREAIGRLAARPRLSSESQEVDPELARQIQALGYVAAGSDAGDAPEPLEQTGRPSPADRLEEFQQIGQADALLNQGRAPEALEILARIVPGSPDNVHAARLLSSALLQVRRFRKAIPLLERLSVKSPRDAGICRDLSYAQRMAGRLPQAIESLWRAIELEPGHEVYFEELMWILKDRPDEAQEYRRRREELLKSRG